MDCDDMEEPLAKRINSLQLAPADPAYRAAFCAVPLGGHGPGGAAGFANGALRG